MTSAADAVRFVYNLALEQRRDFWRQAKAAGAVFNAMSQGLEIKELMKASAWLAEAVTTTALYYALIDLDRAFASFWRGGGYPQFRSKHRHCAFKQKGREVRFVRMNEHWALIRVPKIGLVKMRVTREWLGRVSMSRKRIRGALSFTHSSPAPPR